MRREILHGDACSAHSPCLAAVRRGCAVVGQVAQLSRLCLQTGTQAEWGVGGAVQAQAASCLHLHTRSPHDKQEVDCRDRIRAWGLNPCWLGALPVSAEWAVITAQPVLCVKCGGRCCLSRHWGKTSRPCLHVHTTNEGLSSQRCAWLSQPAHTPPGLR